MKKLLALVLAFAMACTVLVGCGGSKPAEKEDGGAGAAHKVGISMTSQMQQRWAKEGEYLKKLCEGKGYEAVLTWANDDSVRQAADIENLVAQGCDVIIVCPVDQEALDAALKTAHESGVFVVDYDRTILNTPYVDYCTISCDITDMPPIWANFFIEKFDLDADDGKSYTIEFFGGSPTESAAILWMDETVKLLQPYLDSGKLVCRSGQTTSDACGIANWDTTKAQDRMENLLTAFYSDGSHPDIILSPNDSIALGIVNALKNAGHDDPSDFPCITGQDCDVANMQLMFEGFIAHNIFKNTTKLAELTVDAVEKHYNGEELVVDTVTNNGAVEVPTQALDVDEITIDNWYEVLVKEAGYYTLEDLGLTEADIPS